MVRPHILKKNQWGKFGFRTTLERIQTSKVKLYVARVGMGMGGGGGGGVVRKALYLRVPFT